MDDVDLRHQCLTWPLRFLSVVVSKYFYNPPRPSESKSHVQSFMCIWMLDINERTNTEIGEGRNAFLRTVARHKMMDRKYNDCVKETGEKWRRSV
jgi:hypothetical protein